MATTYYLQTDGDDTNLGTDWGVGNAWQTLQKAADTIIQGDTLIIGGKTSGHGTGIWTPNVAIDFDTNTGVGTIYANMIKFIVDGGEAEFDFSGGGGVNGFNISVKDYLMFSATSGSNWKITGATNGLNFSLTGDGNYCIFHRMRFTNCTNGVGGFRPTNQRYFACRFDNNTLDGFGETNAGAGGGSYFWGCRFDNNGRYGCYKLNPASTFFCIFDQNVDDGFDSGNYNYVLHHGSIFYKNTGHGIDMASTNGASISHCIFSENSGQGINSGSFGARALFLTGGNCFYNNTGGHYNVVNYNPTVNAIYADIEDQDPLFTNPDNGDFSLQSGSPCRDYGVFSETFPFDTNFNLAMMQDTLGGASGNTLNPLGTRSNKNKVFGG